MQKLSDLLKRPEMRRHQDLQELLSRHLPADAREAGYLQRMLALCETPQPELSCDVFGREHFSPGHFTASAFILSPDADALLLIYHGKLKRWLQPGGHVDPDDLSILAAAEREIREEVGLSALPLLADGVFDLDIHDIPALNSSPAHAHFDVRFAFRAPSLEFHAASDAEAGRWVRLSDIDEASSDSSVMRAVAKLRARG